MTIIRPMGFMLLALATAVTHADTSSYEKELRSKHQGYLTESTVDSALILPPPPAEGSATKANDEYVNKNALMLYGSDRWVQAGYDSNLYFPSAAKAFSCAANVDISKEKTPTIYKMLELSLVDLGLSSYAAKNKYQRARPFMSNGQGICEISAADREKYGITYEENKEKLSTDGSYPSGHSTIGWGWALIMSEIAPQRANHIFLRGRAFAESRLVCNVHWQSDIIEGKNMAAMTVAQLHTQKQFLKDLEKAQKEYQAAQRKGDVPDPASCEFENKALSTTIGSVM
ncbi:phosphatase PAP2 family protein [Acinetobacter sp. WCHA55]|uniref:acid phosphatase n=1 Tax=Acinetobacter sp. WCHA55 TaxID=2004646 RepID=UPI000B3CBB3E|nr:phosphatase PAP2 family protein [Acinetobacter sp. WCHA55]AYA69814.1 phosphatase PAP2 family protein [Acinetobacter sp. WCHA55]